MMDAMVSDAHSHGARIRREPDASGLRAPPDIVAPMTIHTVAPDLKAGHPKSLSGSPNRWLVLIAMTGALSMIMLDQTVVSVALPSMSRELPLSSTGQQWVVNAYVLAMASLVALGGKLGDRFGGVTTFRFGVVIFFLASMAWASPRTGRSASPG